MSFCQGPEGARLWPSHVQNGITVLVVAVFSASGVSRVDGLPPHSSSFLNPAAAAAAPLGECLSCGTVSFPLVVQ